MFASQVCVVIVPGGHHFVFLDGLDNIPATVIILVLNKEEGVWPHERWFSQGILYISTVWKVLLLLA